MSAVNKPPFRADHVGSLLRPPELLHAREQKGKGGISGEELRSVEDRCIRDVVKMQEDIGLHGITDDQGVFTIFNVPPGNYTLKAWHEEAGVVSQQINVAEDGDVRVFFEVPIKQPN